MTYPNAEILAETEWLAARLSDRDVRVLDCRPAEPYLAGHIPGAYALHDAWLKDPTNPALVVTPERAADVFGGLGIDDGVTVITYDAQGGTLAARVWWVLRYYGHTRAKLLNGGWQKWVAEGREVSTRVPLPNLRRFEPRPNQAMVCSLAELQARHTDPDVAIWDVRRPGEYAGTEAAGNPRTGHIPGARRLDWFAVLTPDEPRVFRPPQQIEAMLGDLGLRRDQEVVTHCQAGIRAAHGYFTLELMGFPRPRLYDGSWFEWSRHADTPVTTD